MLNVHPILWYIVEFLINFIFPFHHDFHYYFTTEIGVLKVTCGLL